jgi:hypothetical protein
MSEISIGATCIAASKNIVGATKANPCEVTVNAHGYANGTIIWISGVVGMTELNEKLYTITVTGENTFTLDGVNSSEYTDYGSAGTVTTGTFYAAKQATRMKDLHQKVVRRPRTTGELRKYRDDGTLLPGFPNCRRRLTIQRS